MKFKHLILAIFISLPCICEAQEQENTYRLFKNGKEYQRPVIYLAEDSFEKIYEKGQKIFFLTERDQFVYNPRIHSSFILHRENLDTINFSQPKDLYSLEENEYNEKARMILKETGIKPVPPIEHSILKIFIVRKQKSGYCAYEVKWM